MKTVALSWNELRLAAQVGMTRRIDDMQKGCVTKYGVKEKDKWANDPIGAIGEMAVAKMLGIYWSGAFEVGALDVGRVEVRTSCLGLTSGHLLLHRDDSSKKIYVYVRMGASRVLAVVGWIYGHEGKQRKFWDDKVGGRPCFFVPERVLHPVKSLRKAIEQEGG